jgi:hypothetical protein
MVAQTSARLEAIAAHHLRRCSIDRRGRPGDGRPWSTIARKVRNVEEEIAGLGG